MVDIAQGISFAYILMHIYQMHTRISIEVNVLRMKDFATFDLFKLVCSYTFLDNGEAEILQQY